MILFDTTSYQLPCKLQHQVCDSNVLEIFGSIQTLIFILIPP